MIKLLIALLIVFSPASFADISIVMKGYYTPVCDGLAISKHTRLDKAFVAAINYGGDCDIFPPDRYELRRDPEPEPILESNDIFISWTKPTRREDDSILETIDRYILYYNINGVVQNPIQIEADSVDFTLADAQAGAYTFWMSTVSHGAEGSKSAPLEKQVN